MHEEHHQYECGKDDCRRVSPLKAGQNNSSSRISSIRGTCNFATATKPVKSRNLPGTAKDFVPKDMDYAMKNAADHQQHHADEDDQDAYYHNGQEGTSTHGWQGTAATHTVHLQCSEKTREVGQSLSSRGCPPVAAIALQTRGTTPSPGDVEIDAKTKAAHKPLSEAQSIKPYMEEINHPRQSTKSTAAAPPPTAAPTDIRRSGSTPHT